MWTPVSRRYTPLRLQHIEGVFFFIKTSGSPTKATGSECQLYVLYCQVRSRCISQGLQVGHDWIEFKIFKLQVLTNGILKINYS